MNWNEYKEHVKQTDPVGKEILEEAEAEAAIISAMIKQRAALGMSQRELARLCDIPQSSIARIETSKTTPRLDTILKIYRHLGLTLRVASVATKYDGKVLLIAFHIKTPTSCRNFDVENCLLYTTLMRFYTHQFF